MAVLQAGDDRMTGRIDDLGTVGHCVDIGHLAHGKNVPTSHEHRSWIEYDFVALEGKYDPIAYQNPSVGVRGRHSAILSYEGASKSRGGGKTPGEVPARDNDEHCDREEVREHRKEEHRNVNSDRL